MDLSVHCDGLIALCHEAIERFSEKYYETHQKPKYITNEFIHDCEEKFIDMLKDYPLSRVIYSWLKQFRNEEWDIDYSEYEDDEDHLTNHQIVDIPIKGNTINSSNKQSNNIIDNESKDESNKINKSDDDSDVQRSGDVKSFHTSFEYNIDELNIESDELIQFEKLNQKLKDFINSLVNKISLKIVCSNFVNYVKIIKHEVVNTYDKETVDVYISFVDNDHEVEIFLTRKNKHIDDNLWELFYEYHIY